jgi:chromosome segregation ATPase
LKLEQTKVAVAEALTQELREVIKKLNDDIKLLKQDKQELREDVESEKKVHAETEKKLTALSARADSQEWAYKEMISNLEKDLEIAREEASAVRTRMIKAEGKLERETKAIERLETKLVAAAGGNKH